MKFRLKVLGGFGVVIGLAVAALIVWAQVTQNDQTTGRVEVIGDILTVSPTSDWVTATSLGGPAESGLQKLTFSNATLTDATVLHMSQPVLTPPAMATAFASHLILHVGWAVAGVCPETLPIPVDITVGGRAFNKLVAAGTSAELCANLKYDGGGPAAGVVDIAFTFQTELAE